MSTAQFSVQTAFLQLSKFIRFVLERFPVSYALLVLSVVSLVLEYLATSLMIPLASPERTSGVAVTFWSEVANFVGFEPSMRMWIWLFFMLMCMRLILGYVLTVATTVLGKMVHRSLSNKIFRHVVAEEPLVRIHERSIGHYIILAGDDTFRCGNIVGSFLQIGMGVLTAFITLVVLYQFSYSYFLGIVFFLCACGLGIGLMLQHFVRLNLTSVRLSRELNTAFIESMNALRSIRALVSEYLVISSYGNQISRYVRQLVKIESFKMGMRYFPAILLLLTASWITRPGGDLTPDEAGLFAVTVIVIRLFVSLGQVVAAGMLMLTDLRALHDIDEIIGLSDDSVALSASAAQTKSIRIQSLELRNIDFSYSGHAPIFQNANFRFEAGNTYAIIGPSGAGKSTLADLLLGLVDPQRGGIWVNDECLDVHTLRKQILLVEQQPRIFSTTLRDNLLFGEVASDEALWDALELVDLASNVRSIPNGLDSELSYQGENFSGGQRQRIGVARAILRRPEVLVLDEATSALDSSSREILLTNISLRMKQGILIYITHDPEVVARADFVFDLGCNEIIRTSGAAAMDKSAACT